MNDLSKPQEVALAIGQRWRHTDGSPWPSTSPAVVITDLKDGWVRHSFDVKPATDERNTEAFFREFYNELVLMSVPVKTRQPDAIVGIKITVEGVETEIDAEVFGKWHEGEARTYSSPGTPKGWEIEEVKWRGTFLTPLLSEDQLDAIARALEP